MDETLQPGLNFDNFKPRVKSFIFECISWLNGLFFGRWWSGVLKQGVQTYLWAPMSPLMSKLDIIFFCINIYSLRSTVGMIQRTAPIALQTAVEEQFNNWLKDSLRWSEAKPGQFRWRGSEEGWWTCRRSWRPSAWRESPGRTRQPGRGRGSRRSSCSPSTKSTPGSGAATQTSQNPSKRNTINVWAKIVTEITVRWSNFDPLDPKMGVFLQSTEATPCGHLLKWKLTPKNPPVDTMFIAAMAMVLPRKIVEDSQSFVKKIRNFDPHSKNLYLARTWV